MIIPPPGTIARIRVTDGPTESWPLAERIARGWQSGVMFYPDEKVVEVTATYTRVDDGGVADQAMFELREAATSRDCTMTLEGFARAIDEVKASTIERLAESDTINAAGIFGPWDDVVFTWLRKVAASVRTESQDAPEETTDMTADVDPALDEHRDVVQLLREGAALAAHDAELVAAIVAKVRNNCTLDWEVMKKGGDPIIYAVADWIENPPEWVKAPWATPVPSDAGSES